MDKRNAYDLRAAGIPGEKIAALSTEEITDPYRKSEQVFEQTYRRIAGYIDQLVSNNN
jgi:protein-tyrosine-phosphatase